MLYGRASLAAHTHKLLFPMRFGTVSSAPFFCSLHSLLVFRIFYSHTIRINEIKNRNDGHVQKKKSENTFVAAVIFLFYLFIWLIFFYFSYLILSFYFKCKIFFLRSFVFWFFLLFYLYDFNSIFFAVLIVVTNRF